MFRCRRAHGEKAREGEGRDWADAAPGQGHRREPGKHQELEEGPGASPSPLSGGSDPANPWPSSSQPPDSWDDARAWWSSTRTARADSSSNAGLLSQPTGDRHLCYLQQHVAALLLQCIQGPGCQRVDGRRQSHPWNDQRWGSCLLRAPCVKAALLGLGGSSSPDV